MKQWFSVFAVLTLLSGCLSSRWENLPTEKSEERAFYVQSHGWHTGIIISVSDLSSELEYLKTIYKNADYIEFGFGDADFYQAKKITLWMTLKAVLWPTSGVMHVVAIKGPLSFSFPFARRVTLNTSETGLLKLGSKIAESFSRNVNKEFIYLGESIYGEGGFYLASHSYHLFNTCNTWSARMLSSGGVPVSSFFTLSADSIIKQSEEAKRSYKCCQK